MKKLLALFIIGIFSLAGAKDYVVDVSHSQVEFKVKHLSVSNVKGNFGKFNGDLAYDGKKITALNGEVEIGTINTNNDARDAHIKDAEYFDAAKFPKATLKLTKMSGKKGTFDLTIKGITKQVKFDVEVFGTSKNQAGKEIVGLNISGKINRKDFDIAKNTPNAALGDEIQLSIDIEGAEK